MIQHSADVIDQCGNVEIENISTNAKEKEEKRVAVVNSMFYNT